MEKSRKALSSYNATRAEGPGDALVACVSALRRRPPIRSEIKSVTAGLSLAERAPQFLRSTATTGNKGTSCFTLEKLEVQDWWSGSIAG